MKISLKSEQMKTFMWCLVATYATMFVPSAAMAGTGGAVIGDLLCSVVEWFTGPLGQGLATLAIIVIGVGALMGKVSWGMAIIVGIGIAVIFGAPEIVSQFNDGAGGCE